jgi:hypothetical protein
MKMYTHTHTHTHTQMDQVHEIERRALPSLMASPGTDADYKAMRNSIISLYREVPGRPLGAIDCLRHMTADAGKFFSFFLAANFHKLSAYDGGCRQFFVDKSHLH